MGRISKNNKKKKKRKSKINAREFNLDLENIEKVGKTTLMIKNIPNRYNKNMLVRTLNKNHAGKFDFFYLPIDFKVIPYHTILINISRINATLATHSSTSFQPASSNHSTSSSIIKNGRSSTVTK